MTAQDPGTRPARPSDEQPLVLVATAAEVPDLDAEGRLLLAALEAAGARARPAVWTDDREDWGAADLVVVRCTWDYARRRDAFLAWADRVAAATTLLNPPGLLRWTTDKAYLAELAAAGVPVVPSLFLDDVADHDLLDVEHVVKPSVSAGSLDTLRVAAGDREASLAQVRAILATGRTALVQPYLDQVDEHGETALVHLDGRFSHAMRKAAILTPDRGDPADDEGLFVQEEMSARTASADELALGERVLDIVGARGEGTPLYCRVDLLPTDDGPLVLEVELAEPSLFLEHVAGSADRLAEAVVGRLPR